MTKSTGKRTKTDLTGKRVNNFTILHRSPNPEDKGMWVCRCDCGEIRISYACRIQKSCGCMRAGLISQAKTLHGMCESSTYHVWAAMVQRCTNPSNKRFADYGGRGITLEERWKEFATFIKEMGVRPDDMTLERVNNNKGYGPTNCFWATRAVQNRNSRNTTVIEFEGTQQCLSDWATDIGINVSTLLWRIRVWGVERALRTPHQQPKRRRKTQ